MSTDVNTDLTIADAQLEELHETYRHLHAHPELSMQEHETAAYIERRLDELGLDHFRCGGTGVVSVIANGEGPVVAFRADIDGLPIEESTDLAYASTATGTLPDGTAVPVMHGCGHDVHASVGLSAARWFAQSRDRWAGTIVFVFQPGEETAAGAAAMVADGLWDRAPRPEVVFGQHVMGDRAGTVSAAVGPAMAMADSLKVTVYGRQAHGSQPHQAIDSIVLAAHMVVRLQTIVSREVDPTKAAVVTVGTFHAGLKENIIPGTAEFALNVRTLDEKVRKLVLGSIRRIVTAEAQASGAPEPVIEELYRFPPCENDPDETQAVLEALRGTLGDDAVSIAQPLTGSEDFGSLATALDVPSVFWIFGGHPPELLESGEPVPGNHSPHFAPVIEPTLTTGLTAVLTVLTARLANGSPEGGDS